MRTVELSNYTIGEDCFDAIPEVLTLHKAKKIMLIGGERALAAAAPGIEAAVAGTDIEVLGRHVYGKNSTLENIAKIVNSPLAQAADALFAIGGGKAIDTVKTANIELNKTVFSVPTICSNCSAGTAIAVVYNADGSLEGYSYPHCPDHIFINPAIIAAAPAEYFWAGIGDALSKEYEVVFACRDKDMTHTPLLGRVLAEACTKPLVSYGKKALEDCRNNVSSKNIEQIALDIIITTGLVSNFTVHQNNPDPKDDYYYNSSLAHCVYYGASLFPKCEHDHLHGEIVSFGVLCLLTYDEQFEERQHIFEFNHSIGLPCTLGEIALTEEDVPAIAHKAASVVEWTYVPGEPKEKKFIKAILDTDKAGKEFLAKA